MLESGIAHPISPRWGGQRSGREKERLLAMADVLVIELIMYMLLTAINLIAVSTLAPLLIPSVISDSSTFPVS